MRSHQFLSKMTLSFGSNMRFQLRIVESFLVNRMERNTQWDQAIWAKRSLKCLLSPNPSPTFVLHLFYLIWPHPFFRMVLSILRGDCQKPLTLVSIGRHIYATLDNSNYNHQKSSVCPHLFSNFNDRTGCLQAFQMHFKISSALFTMMMVFATSTVIADICPTLNQWTELKVDQAVAQIFRVRWFKRPIIIFFFNTFCCKWGTCQVGILTMLK